MKASAYLLGIIGGFGLLMVVLLQSINGITAQTTYTKYGYQALNTPDEEIVAVKTSWGTSGTS